MRVEGFSSLLGALAFLSACSGAGAGGSLPPPPNQALRASSQTSAGHIELRQLEARPRLTLVAREGDPSPALVATVASDLGPVPTTALAAVVEHRLRAAGLSIDARVDRSAFRLRLSVDEPSRVPLFFRALRDAFVRPIVPGAPELELARERLAALKRHPLDAIELVPVAACTGELGIAPGEPVPDLATPAAALELDAARAKTLSASRTSIAAVGPSGFGQIVVASLKQSEGWPEAPAAADVWPKADALGAYTSATIPRGSSRLTLAVRVANPLAAAAAAERLAEPDGLLRERLGALPQAFRLVRVVGVARPLGGCLAATIESQEPSGTLPVESAAAIAGALLRQEMSAELVASASASTATRQILTAADPREAASRAAWWALSNSAPPAAERWASALGLEASSKSTNTSTTTHAAASRFGSELDRALAAMAAPIFEQKSALERGQGELWALLATPCGVAEEDSAQAGLSALAILSGIQVEQGRNEVTLEPWITSDGLGVIAHAPFNEHESPIELARRVGAAAARVLAASSLSRESAESARASLLSLLERTTGRESAALGVFAGALSPGHPSWVEPFGLFEELARSNLDAIRLRRRALGSGPLRLALLANDSPAQAEAAARAVRRWLVPSPTDRSCNAGETSAPRPGRYEAHLPKDAHLAQALLGAPFPASGGKLATLTAIALNEPGGSLEELLRPLGAQGSARVVGGRRSPALLIDLRAPEDALADAITALKSRFSQLPSALSDAGLARAQKIFERNEAETRAHPRGRLIDLWAGAPRAPADKPKLDAWRAFVADTLKESALIVVEARPN